MSTIIKNIKQLDLNGKYTYADYLLWQFKERVELIKGKILEMSPAPSRKHQDISGNIFFELRTFFNNHPCNLYAAPFDVRLIDSKKPAKKDSDFNTVVQPDLCVICDESKLDDRGCVGSPDVVIEILSPGNTNKEMKTKFRIYEENQIPEYWMVDSSREVIYIYTLVNKKYQGLQPLTNEDKMKSALYPKMKFNIKNIFK